MGLLLLGLPRRLLIGVQRLGQAEPRRIARETPPRRRSRRPPRGVAGHLGAIDRGARGMGEERAYIAKSGHPDAAQSSVSSAPLLHGNSGVTRRGLRAVIISNTMAVGRTAAIDGV
jgi:hypothetical protein